MSALRQVNWLGQQRVDTFHVRALDSSVAADFDCLAGLIYAGSVPTILTGFTIPVAGTLGNRASNLVLRVASSSCIHPTATDSGSIFFLPAGTADEPLSSSNGKVSGAFAASATNYVGVDLVREAQEDTSDLTKFLDPTTIDEIDKVVPVGRVLQIRIIISTLPFSSTTNVMPVAKVVTDASANVVSITDARTLGARLAPGGDTPNATAGYNWPDASRFENPITYSSLSSLDPFAGGDKGIGSIKNTIAAIEHVLWEGKSGESWYSRTTRDGVKLAMGSTTFGNGDNFIWDNLTNTLSWTGLAMLFENSSGGFKNPIADGSLVILDGQCMYVDIDRSTTPSPSLVMSVASLQSVGAPTIPGSRFILVYRNGADIQIRDRPFNVERLTSLFSLGTKHYPDVYVSATPGEGDYTTLASAFAAVPAYGGVVVVMSDMSISASVTIPANVKVIARNGVTLTLVGAGTEVIMSDRSEIDDWYFTSTKTTGVFVRATGYRCVVRHCKFDVAPAGTATGFQIDGNAAAVHTSEFTGVIAPSTGTGVATGALAQDYYVAGDNVFAQ